MDRIQALIHLADTFAGHAGITHFAVSMRIFGKGDFFQNLKKGGDCRTRTEARALSWFDENWPEDLEWPAGIDRPSDKRGAA